MAAAAAAERSDAMSVARGISALLLLLLRRRASSFSTLAASRVNDSASATDPFS